MSEPILIAGATARGAAQSALRAGWDVTAADLFRDRDLVACGVARRVHDYPSEIVTIAAQFSPRAWMYTGGLENMPEVVAAVSQFHTLLGNPPDVLRQVRDPWRVQRVLRDAGLLFPRIRAECPAGEQGSWLRKPRKSCGGAGIRVWRGVGSGAEPPDVDGDAPGSDAHFFQQRVGGAAYGALYVASRHETTLLGVTRQLAGCRWAGATGFRYVGSVGPVPLDPYPRTQFERIGQCLAAAFGLRGLFGVDAIVEGGRVWTIEVNPRYTASAEIHERASGLCTLHFHALACRGGELPVIPPPEVANLHGKAIIYAPQSAVIDDAFCHWVDRQNHGQPFPLFADLPHPGTTVSARHPILTVLAQGHSCADVCRQLQTQSKRVQAAVR